MCGRYTLETDRNALVEAFRQFVLPDELEPRYNIAPSQNVAAVANNGRNTVEFFRWGLIPGWAKDPAIGHRMINARAETLAEKPSFRTSLRRRRCLILADGFYEWRKDPGGKTKTPMYIRLGTGAPFAFAGLWDLWRGPDETPVTSCTIITTSPNELLAPIHNRMPVILPADAYERWLDPDEQPADRLLPLLNPYPAREMTAHPVSRAVNNPRTDSPDCIKPTPAQP